MQGDDRIRIMHLVNGEYWSGAERVQSLLGRFIDQSRFDLEFLCLKEGLYIDRARELGLRVSQIKMDGRHDLSVLPGIVRRIRDTQVDVIHTHTVRSTMIGRMVGALTRTPVVTHVHSPSLRESDNKAMNLLNTVIDRSMDRLTSRYIAVSKSLGDELRRSGVGANRVVIVPNGIDVSSLHPGRRRTEARRVLEVPVDAPLVGMIGLFRARKGPEVLIDAFKQLVVTVPNAYLVLLGPMVSDEYGAKLREQVHRVGIAERVRFPGFRDDATELLSGFDVVAMPSLYGEGTPMVLLESMAMGVPVVATPVEGIADVVVDGVTGRLVPPGNPSSLATALAALLTDEDARTCFGNAARTRAETNYSAERMASEVENVYLDLVPGALTSTQHSPSMEEVAVHEPR